MNYIEVRLQISPFKEEFAELVEAVLCDLPYESFRIEDPYLYCYVKEDDYSFHDTKTVLSFFDNSPDFKILESHNLIQDRNWNSEWEKNFTPILVGNTIAVKAPFHVDVPKAKYNIKIEPRMAFGTGHHQTTILMMMSIMMLAGEDVSQFPKEISVEFNGDFLLPKVLSGGRTKNLIKNSTVMDMGTGTGILTFLSAKLGAKRPLYAVDIDLNSVNSAMTNAWVNRLNNAVDIMCGDSALIMSGKYNVLYANINRNILLGDMQFYADGLKKNGFLVLSGFYESDVKLLLESAGENGFELCCTLKYEGWTALILKKI